MGFKKIIEVKFVKEGMHLFPGADTDPKYATGGWDDVSFLGKPHFHYFYYVVQVEVTHNNREIEFIQFNRWCQRLYSQGTLEHNGKSCEMLAEDLIEEIRKEYGDRWIKVSVLEDDINGAHVEYTPDFKLTVPAFVKPEWAAAMERGEPYALTNQVPRMTFQDSDAPIPMGGQHYIVTFHKPEEE